MANRNIIPRDMRRTRPATKRDDRKRDKTRAKQRGQAPRYTMAYGALA